MLRIFLILGLLCSLFFISTSEPSAGVGLCTNPLCQNQSDYEGFCDEQVQEG